MITISLILVLCLAANAYGQINPSNCGTRPFAKSDEKIVGGTLAKVGDWGWQVSLLNNGNHYCGGVLIHQSWVLTAGHCYGGSLNPNPATHKIDLGVHDRLNKETWVVTKQATKIIVHPSYNQLTVPKNDIVLIKLDSPVTYNNYILPACIPDGTENYEGYTSWTTGWGVIALTSNTLLRYKTQVSTLILTDTRCKARYGSSYVDTNSAICAGENAANLGPCKGDSGGPLVVQSKVDSKWYVVGLTSWGFECGNGGVYTRVSYFKSWIQQQITSNP